MEVTLEQVADHQEFLAQAAKVAVAAHKVQAGQLLHPVEVVLQIVQLKH